MNSICPNFLYKYYSFERFLELITTRKIYFNNPVTEFNDPYDCSPGITITSQTEFEKLCRRSKTKNTSEDNINHILQQFENDSIIF